MNGAVAQLARAIRSHRIGHGFDSHQLHHLENLRNQEVKAWFRFSLSFTPAQSITCTKQRTPGMENSLILCPLFSPFLGHFSLSFSVGSGTRPKLKLRSNRAKDEVQRSNANAV